MKKIIILLTCICPFFTMCQPISIRGTVLNTENDPVFGATVTIKSNGLTTQTDADGAFYFPSSRLTDTILVSAVGYFSKETPNNERGLLTVRLQKKPNELSEVIVSSGFQKLPKERATGSFEIINAELINRRVSTNLLERLEGVSSVYFDNRRGAAEPLTIRGRSTFLGNAAPMIIVDNVPYEADIENINPNDIENITILKDAAAASVWGARAANGVIVVTTKKGRFNQKPVLQFNTNTTITQKPDLFYAPQLSSEAYIGIEEMLFNNNHYNAALSNTLNYPVVSPVVEILAAQRLGAITQQQAQQQLNNFKQNDVRNDLLQHFYQPAVSSQHAVSYTGGAANFNYILSLGYDHNNANLRRNQTSRLTLRSLFTVKPVHWFQLTLGLQTVQAKNFSANPAINMVPVATPGLYPYSKLVDENGMALSIPKDYRSTFVDTAGAGTLLNWKYSPLQELQEANNRLTANEYRYNLQSEIKWTRFLNTTLTWQLQKQENLQQNLFNENTYFTRNLINLYYSRSTQKFNIPAGSIFDQNISATIANTARLQNNLSLNWKNRNEVVAIAGAEVRQTKATSSSYRVFGYDPENQTFTNVNFADNFQLYNNLRSQQPIPNNSSFSTEIFRFISAYANAAYTRDNKYILSFSARKDASNIFGVTTNRKGVPLWSSGFAWIISKESFYHAAALPYLKLRATYGVNGNVDNSMAAVTTIRYATRALFTQLPYATIQNIPNPSLRWEQTKTINIGIDFASKADRIKGSIEWFSKQGVDLIGFAPIDPTTGVQTNATFSYKGNVASMQGQGIELNVTSRNTVGVVQWSTALIANYVESKVKNFRVASVSAGTFINQGLSISPVTGSHLYSIYAYRWAGLNPANGDPQGFLNNNVSTNYNSLVNAPVQELAYKGSAVPVVFGSCMNTIRWKQFSCSVNMIYKLGYSFMRSTVNYSVLLNGTAAHPDYEKRWQKPGDEVTTNVPSFIYPNPGSNRDALYRSAEIQVEKGDHIRLQDISLSYDLPVSQKWKWMQTMKCYTYFNNLGIIWRANKLNIDPDYFAGGYPLPRSVAFGIKASF
ncbi:SusC/RagA family TonB-linked outer membrane protein [Lacibacter sp. H407]|uniref:SusC/RagA family TonB-linked outer membrane protein n=1 Tax=Lacibacter sp. H407 TaxID=3133423 RepID=UPI0030C324CE